MNKKNLKLNQELIEEQITFFCSDKGLEITGPKVINNITRYIIKKDGNIFNIDFYFKQDGTTTIQTNKKDCSFADEVISYIIDKTTISKYNNFNIIVNSATIDHYNYLINYLIDDFDSKKTDEQELEKELRTKIKGAYNDEITIKFYLGTNKLHIQGKPLNLYKHSYGFLSEFSPEISFVDDLKGRVDIKIDEKIIKDELTTFMPKSSHKLHETVQSQIITSLNMKKIVIEPKLPDYSLFAFPVLRGLEASIKLVLQSKDCFNVGNKKLGVHFSQAMSKFVTNPEVTEKINCKKTCDSLSSAYTLYNNERHGLFHSANDINATRILNEDEANTIIDKVIVEIDSLFDNIII